MSGGIAMEEVENVRLGCSDLEDAFSTNRTSREEGASEHQQNVGEDGTEHLRRVRLYTEGTIGSPQ